MNEFILFEKVEEVKLIRIDVVRAGRGGYILKLEQIDQNGKVKRHQKTYLGKKLSAMTPIVKELQSLLVSKGIEPWKIKEELRTINPRKSVNDRLWKHYA